MYFQECSVFRATDGRASPLFQHPGDAASLIWKLGGYDHTYSMFVSQLYPHFHLHDSGAIKRRVSDPPTQGSVPLDDEAPTHPDQHGGVPPDDDDDDDDDDGDDDDDHDDDRLVMNQKTLWMMTINLVTTLDLIQVIMMMTKSAAFKMTLDHHLVMTWTCKEEFRTWGAHDPSPPRTPFSNPDAPVEENVDLEQDDDPSQGPDPTAEPIRVQRRQRHMSVDSTGALPKAKAKVIIKRSKVI